MKEIRQNVPVALVGSGDPQSRKRELLVQRNHQSGGALLRYAFRWCKGKPGNQTFPGKSPLIEHWWTLR